MKNILFPPYIDEILNFLDAQEILSLGSTNKFLNAITCQARVWRRLCNNLGVSLFSQKQSKVSIGSIDNSTSDLGATQYTTQEWKFFYRTVFGISKNYPLRTYEWKHPLNLSLMTNLMKPSHFVREVPNSCKFALEVRPDIDEIPIIICSQPFICSVQTDFRNDMTLIIRLKDLSFCYPNYPNCNCTFRGFFSFHVYSYTLSAEITGCYSHKKLPFTSSEYNEYYKHHSSSNSMQILLYLHAVKGFLVESEDYLVYT